MAQPLPRTVQPPPELPNDPKTSDVLSQWLRTFSLWCRHGFADKLSISTATPSLMMQTEDVPPAVYQLGVTSKPTITLTPIALGSGDPGTPVQIAMRADLSGYLPLSGGTVAGPLTVSGTLTASNNMAVGGNLGTNNFSVGGQTVFYQLAGTIPQATGGSVMVQCPGTGNQAFITFHIPGPVRGQLRHGFERQLLHWGLVVRRGCVQVLDLARLRPTPAITEARRMSNRSARPGTWSRRLSQSVTPIRISIGSRLTDSNGGASSRTNCKRHWSRARRPASKMSRIEFSRPICWSSSRR